ncbi:hypothetical protein OHB26_04090 [Nocardia sp. NBC_01503]|uniref:hypothetical protein n=1 Tax=Nocardia sp. NBC_01503 TaxID=2975997 RepID=UPI002E7BEF54|nr:hypothetical protein [Nocardia sp. NBC_01503]WTL33431.1 hypothetical protein OHB26_04090 [Nocardia sp. NBC_01503]
MTNPYIAPASLPRRTPTDNIDQGPARHAKPTVHLPLSDQDIAALLELHGPRCAADGCELRTYLLELQTARHNDNEPS